MDDDTQRTDPNDVEALRSYCGAPPLSRDVVLGILSPLAERIRALGEGNLDCGCSTAVSQEHITVSTCDEHGGWKATVRERSRHALPKYLQDIVVCHGNSFHHDGGGERACEPAQNLTGENGTNVNHDTIEQRLRNRRDRLERQYDDVQARLTALDHDQEHREREYRAAHGELTDDLRRIEAQRELVDAILAGTEGDEG